MKTTHQHEKWQLEEAADGSGLYCRACGETIEPELFDDISNEFQWEWDMEIEVCRDFIDTKGLTEELARYARMRAEKDHLEAWAYQLRFVTKRDLIAKAVGMPHLHESKKEEIATWLVTYRPDVVADYKPATFPADEAAES